MLAEQFGRTGLPEELKDPGKPNGSFAAEYRRIA